MPEAVKLHFIAKILSVRVKHTRVTTARRVEVGQRHVKEQFARGGVLIRRDTWQGGPCQWLACTIFCTQPSPSPPVLHKHAHPMASTVWLPAGIWVRPASQTCTTQIKENLLHEVIHHTPESVSHGQQKHNSVFVEASMAYVMLI